VYGDLGKEGSCCDSCCLRVVDVLMMGSDELVEDNGTYYSYFSALAWSLIADPILKINLKTSNIISLTQLMSRPINQPPLIAMFLSASCFLTRQLAC
jgi:hypothetical protein